MPENLQHRVLFWGILGALITRGAFIAVGAALLAAFHWVTYIFGAFLVLTGGRLLFGDDEEVKPDRQPGPAPVPPVRADDARLRRPALLHAPRRAALRDAAA